MTVTCDVKVHLPPWHADAADTVCLHCLSLLLHCVRLGTEANRLAVEALNKAESEKTVAAKADNCERVRKGQASLLSGVRIAVINAKGEREFMDDNARLTETRRLQTIADNDCPK